MKLTLSPILGLPGMPETIASIDGDVLTIDGTAYDLSAVPEGGEATPTGEHPFVGSIIRTDGEIIATIMWTYGAGAADAQPADPTHWTVTVTDGPVPTPIVKEQAE
ncbi:hypothetical protein SAMN05444339_11043 [Loktanella atrilutea]|uniref:Uncharacterized protein n=1 Tax=Loktanella atrilutea TaxID=366533 RepID=A0A1M5DL29_LOKAT|nr:hypothetical protein [Loktanella atrilutea]SHF67709.1 hypothetical protein SAMN05444339_11043 [Loktanella atrilutea]